MLMDPLTNIKPGPSDLVIKTADEGLSLLQTKYIQDILKKAGLEGCKSCSILKLTATGGAPFDNHSLYRSSPYEDHWKVVKHILRYLSGTLLYGLHLKKGRNLPILAYCDSDWDSDPDDCKSTSGTSVFVGPNPVSWSSKKQTVVGEYRSMAIAMADVV
ncbi:uncharacterized mitochondrial protein AtMg00810-like [Arachis stenosperma]|uniref:uncharacterized mitochondrial protein AtMg00810-like n=1 Tax=Arachis stenosperma TaxID=217475 RepID=UPI0025ABD29F|nr:uncharacterized mitochondrial protein AtMg00810-like [Arachis stenosperma]